MTGFIVGFVIGFGWVYGAVWTYRAIRLGNAINNNEAVSGLLAACLILWPLGMAVEWSDIQAARAWRKQHGRNRRTEKDYRNSQTRGTTGGTADGAGQGAIHGPGGIAITGFGLKTSGPLVSKPAGWRFSNVAFNYGSYVSYSGNPRTPLELPERSEPPTVHEDMPILACRYAGLVFTDHGPKFKAVNDQFGTFGRDAEATCNKHDDDYQKLITQLARSLSKPLPAPPPHDGHTAPGVHCQCGFYAVPADQLPKHQYTGLLLQVELSGRVIEHETGYRAEHQRVISVQTPACSGCGKPATRCWFQPHNTDVAIAWLCNNHEVHIDKGPLVAVTVDQLSESLGIPFETRPPQ